MIQIEEEKVLTLHDKRKIKHEGFNEIKASYQRDYYQANLESRRKYNADRARVAYAAKKFKKENQNESN